MRSRRLHQASRWLSDCSDRKYSRASRHTLSHNNKNTFVSTHTLPRMHPCMHPRKHTHTHTHTGFAVTVWLQWHKVLQGVLAHNVTHHNTSKTHLSAHTHTHTHTLTHTRTHTLTQRGKEQQANTIEPAHTTLRKLFRWDYKARSPCIPIQKDHICTLKILWSMSEFSGLWKQEKKEKKMVCTKSVRVFIMFKLDTPQTKKKLD